MALGIRHGKLAHVAGVQRLGLLPRRLDALDTLDAANAMAMYNYGASLPPHIVRYHGQARGWMQRRRPRDSCGWELCVWIGRAEDGTHGMLGDASGRGGSEQCSRGALGARYDDGLRWVE